MPDQIVLPPEASGPLNAQGAARATELVLAPEERLAAFGTSTADPSPLLSLGRLVDALVAPLSVDGSTVWARNADPDLCVSRWAAEQITAVLAPLPAGITAPGQVTRIE